MSLWQHVYSLSHLLAHGTTPPPLPYPTPPPLPLPPPPTDLVSLVCASLLDGVGEGVRPPPQRLRQEYISRMKVLVQTTLLT